MSYNIFEHNTRMQSAQILANLISNVTRLVSGYAVCNNDHTVEIKVKAVKNGYTIRIDWDNLFLELGLNSVGKVNDSSKFDDQGMFVSGNMGSIHGSPTEQGLTHLIQLALVTVESVTEWSIELT